MAVQEAPIAVSPPAVVGSEAEVVARMDRLPVSGLHAKACGLVGLCTFFNSLDSLIMPAALAVIVGSLHISFLDVGFLLSSAYVGMAVGALILGWLGEIFGRKPLLVWTVAGFGLLSIAGAFTWDQNSLLIVRIIQGLALGGEIPVATALYTELLPGKARGKLFFYGFTIQFTAGLFVAPLAGLACIALLGPELGWRALFALGGLSVLVAAAVQWLVPESPRFLAHRGRYREADAVVKSFEESALDKVPLPPAVIRPQTQQLKTSFMELFQGVYARRTIVSWTLAFASNFVTYGLATWLPTLYVRVGGLSASHALMATLLFGGVQFAAQFMWGALADHLGRRRGFIIGYSLAILGMGTGVVAAAVYGFTGWPVLVVVAFVTGLGIGFTTSLCFLYTAELFPTRMRAWASATGTASNRIGSFLAPTVIGLLLGAGFGITSAFLAMGLAALVGLVCVAAFGPETSKGTLEEVSR